MDGLALVSVNIERSKHLDRVLAFLERQAPDVVCMQELMEYDIPAIEARVGPLRGFAPMTRHPSEGKPGTMGIGIFSRWPLRSSSLHRYRGSDKLHDFDMTTLAKKYASESCSVLVCDIEKDDVAYRIATTHFTWTPDGEPNEFQHADMPRLLAVLDGLGEFVLTGDFNAPRGGLMFAELSRRYTDNIPPQYATSLDMTLHRAADQAGKRLSRLMVDGLFTTPGYRASGVRLQFGVSDHAAIVATIACSH